MLELNVSKYQEPENVPSAAGNSIAYINSRYI
jgi:hypothetical protein